MLRSTSTWLAALTLFASCPTLSFAQDAIASDGQKAEHPEILSQWLPDNGRVFPDLKADPRQPRMSLGWRWHDKNFQCNLVSANIGGEIPIWYTREIKGFDELQISLQGATWSLFDMNSTNFDLVNTDFYGGIPLSARIGENRLRLRLYHISSHEGDGWLRRHGFGPYRKPSYEVVDLTCYVPAWKDQLYAYGTVGHVIHYNSTFPMGRTYFEAGAEFYGESLVAQTLSLKAYPYAALHLRSWEYVQFKPSVNLSLGLLWEDKQHDEHQLSTSIEYFAGHSLEGVYNRNRTHYLYVQLAYLP